VNTARVMRSSALMAGGTAASRLLGFVRAALLAAAVAPGPAADTFSIANTIPNALYILLAGGILNAVLVPQITRAAKQADGGQEYIDRLLTAAIAALFVITLAITIAAPLFIRLYASSDWSPDQSSLATAFALWCLPQVFFYGLYTMLGQVLNARGSFGPFMWAPVVNNIVGIAGLIAFIAVAGTSTQPIDTWTTGRVALLSFTATLGVVAQAVILIPAMRRAGIGFTVRWGLRGFGLRTASRVAGWTFASVIVQQIGFIVVSQVTTRAQGLAERADSNISSGKAVYDNALLLFMLPHSLVAVSLVTALFTRMSISAADNRIDDVRSDLSLGLRLTGLATVVSAVTFLALGPEIMGALFPGNSAADHRGFAYVTMAMMIGLVPFSAQYLFQRAFYAFEDAKTPFLVQIPINSIWAFGNLLSLWFLPARWIVVGVGFSMAVGNTAGALLSLYLLHRKLGRLDGRRVFITHMKYLAGAGAGGAAAWVLARVTHGIVGDSWLASLLSAGIGGIVILVVYYIVLKRLRVAELDDALGPLLRRSKKRGGKHVAAV
jgi:putative peptidoglycan lipid II flippase